MCATGNKKAIDTIIALVPNAKGSFSRDSSDDRHI
jgi:ankyrin repeat protein